MRDKAKPSDLIPEMFRVVVRRLTVASLIGPLVMDEQENPLERDHCLSVVLPGGLEKNTTVHGSKPVMDLLVTLCASYHLNPSDYTVEVLSPNRNNIGFKPNSPIGSLEAEKIVLKPRSVEEKIRRPYMPEASVRLLINYNKSHKTVVRVNPRVPLEMLLPVVCDKCEFNSETTILLRDHHSKEPLDLTKTLNEHGLRELFAKDTAEVQDQPKTPEPAVTPTEVISPPPLQDLPKRVKKQKENTGFLSLFRRGKKKPETEVAGSLPASPFLNKQVNGQDVSPLKTPPADMPKKRRAPQPPMSASQSVPSNLSTCHLRGTPRSAESTLRSTKRRAPPPPCANTNREVQADTEVKGPPASLNTVEELRESDESDSLSSSSSPHPSQPRSSSSSTRPSLAQLCEAADPYLPSFRGKDLSDARCALAKVMTSSVSKRVLVKRLRNSTAFPKFCNGSTFMSTRGSDNGVFWAANLPTEPEWEDPVQRRGMTTFKVVPSMKDHDPERTPGVPDQITDCEASPQAGRNQTEEDPCSSDRSETETPPQSPEPSSQETHAASLSTPLDLDTQDCPGSPLAEVKDSLEMEKDKGELKVTSEMIPTTPSDCGDGELGSLSTPLDLDIQDCPGSPPSEVEKPKEEDEPEITFEVISAPSHCSDGEFASLPAPLDLDYQDCPGSPPSEVEKEEDEPEVASEVIPAAPSDCNDGELLSDEDQSEFPQSPSRRSASPDMDHRGSCTEEREVEEEEEEEDEDSFPPPPPPVFFEDIEVTEEGREVTTTEQSAAAPNALDRMRAAPSKFAQAVALAVQRSRLQRGGKVVGPQDPKGPDDALPSPPRSIYQYGEYH
ncbi:Cordon-bleu protein-like 1 [Collichthys lucidus]|uniref:Cordon-bleu protein-like 1 n=1 Tax=Collichthys lucidus TaxID=240159 RepID=A0A4U5TXI4_COLLU|nr:Cordon-bleu protein-like 1 [Collichthys lucidus]